MGSSAWFWFCIISASIIVHFQFIFEDNRAREKIVSKMGPPLLDGHGNLENSYEDELSMTLESRLGWIVSS
jgi:hypothetical protein